MPSVSKKATLNPVYSPIFYSGRNEAFEKTLQDR
jgi:hypothetical protein